ncbi:hypothetical protein [Pseudovibrio sp. WM33]|uniref:hypothetical protein n=1 Tax=Pseudovibrio sp. WM33 TaxID=1735585 RepID=UPI0007AE9CDE|nr:hypothetical protein [Pseudovibrio sp. WM33]KZL24702.1 hypothetical protein PsWM33_02376 [Pseudovibrio sp. WM33]
MTNETLQRTTYSPAQARAAGIKMADYPFDNAPGGEVEAIFIAAVWGRNTALRCLFETEDGLKFSVNTYQRREYKLEGGHEVMRYQEVGTKIRLRL